jgi:hypothetical protein
MHRVVGDESSGGGSVPLGIEEARVVGHTRQQGRAALDAIFLRQPVLRQRSTILWIIFPGAGNRILQGQNQRWRAGRLIGDSCRRHGIGIGLREDQRDRVRRHQAPHGAQEQGAPAEGRARKTVEHCSPDH